MQHKTTATLQLITSVGLMAFWTAFFTVGFENPDYPDYYTKFEHSFPLPSARPTVYMPFSALKLKSHNPRKIIAPAATSV